MNILLTSVGRRSYLVDYFKESLNGIGKVFVSNSTDECPAFKHSDYKVVTPLIYDDSYIPFLKKYCLEHSISVIIPLFDVDVLKLSEFKKEFEDIGIHVLVGDYEKMLICNDKYTTFEELTKNNIDVPKTYKNLADVKSSLVEEVIQFPVILKPRWGMGSIGIYEASNLSELDIFYNKVKKDISNSYLKYESSIDIEESVLIQEKVNGIEYGLDIINNLEGKYQTTIVKEKIEMRAGETDCAITRENKELETIGRKVSRIISHPANLDCDVIRSDDKFFVLELNARFGGGYPFSYMAGVDLPKAIVKWLRNETLHEELIGKNNVKAYKEILIQKY